MKLINPQALTSRLTSNFKSLFALLAFSLVATAALASGPAYVPSTLIPPAPRREFRGAWIATVANIDWPSKPGLPVEEQKAELLTIMDRAVKLNLNALIFQVRPACDAMYESKIEPWSYYLTGTMGKAPQPFYDPLAFAITEAHKRGLELHAWFNPYRAGLLAPKYSFAPNHIRMTHPEFIRRYGDYLWLDPGERDVEEYSLRVVMDVVKRYDIDGVHFDDYFYPYPIQDSQKRDIPFPDETSWRKFGASGKMNRADWRRDNINSFVQRAYISIKEAKPWVKVGISPFGIWRPGNPQQIKGMDAYEKISADSRKWLADGWLDYCAPQLYWAIESPDQCFPVLLKWWQSQNALHRNLWPGINSNKVDYNMPGQVEWKPEEIVNQIRLTRSVPGVTGNIHYSMKCLRDNQGGLATILSKGVYAEPALIPASPWLESSPPGVPRLKIGNNGTAEWESGTTNKISWWVLQTESSGQWSTSILPGDIRSHSLANGPDAVSLTAIDRCGMASQPVVLERGANAAK